MEVKIIPSILKRRRYIKYIKIHEDLDFVLVETMNKKTSYGIFIF